MRVFERHMFTYRLRDRLGTGGAARVFRGVITDLNSNETAAAVAVKEFSGDQAKERCEEEVRAMQSLKHKHVVELVGYCVEEENLAYVLLELAESDYTKRLAELSRLPKDRELLQVVLDDLLQIAKGLSHIHDCNVVHLDLKPGNILYFHGGTLKISDFGLSKTLADDRTSVTHHGGCTCMYAAPEQLLGSADKVPVTLNPEADVYSLAVLMCEALTGQRPWHNLLLAEILMKFHRKEVPTAEDFIWPDACPTELRELVQGMLTFEADKRTPMFRVIEILSTLLKDLRNPQTITHRRTAASLPPLQTENVTVLNVASQWDRYTVHNALWKSKQCALKRYTGSVTTPALEDRQRDIDVMNRIPRDPSLMQAIVVVDDGETSDGLLLECDVNLTSPLESLVSRTRTASQATVVRWLHEVARAINLAHNAGLIHGRLGLQDVLVCRGGEGGQWDDASAKLSYYGPMLHHDAMNARPPAMFRAPEVSRSRDGATRATSDDVFSFGMIMWCSLCASKVDHGLGATDDEVINALQNGRRPLLAINDATLSAIIEDCWRRDAAVSMDAIETRLGEWLRDIEDDLLAIQQVA